ncbi:hypothetical protein CSUI_000495 [Cystoisospora suis]|uniref:Transmembrane protein n=1 Tax=Cystoisospora suis TaxID=483139 RepID=A0A2C6LG37_9APIC|nr:hypothetical protein CSUI_000495 [Cystoisospora suis]
MQFGLVRREIKKEVSLRCTYTRGRVPTGKGKKDASSFFFLGWFSSLSRVIFFLSFFLPLFVSMQAQLKENFEPTK